MNGFQSISRVETLQWRRDCLSVRRHISAFTFVRERAAGVNVSRWNMLFVLDLEFQFLKREVPRETESTRLDRERHEREKNEPPFQLGESTVWWLIIRRGSSAQKGNSSRKPLHRRGPDCYDSEEELLRLGHRMDNRKTAARRRTQRQSEPDPVLFDEPSNFKKSKCLFWFWILNNKKITTKNCVRILKGNPSWQRRRVWSFHYHTILLDGFEASLPC